MRMYRCRFCGKEFPKPHGLEIHKRIKHNGKAKSEKKKKPKRRAKPAPKRTKSAAIRAQLVPQSSNAQETLIERLRAKALSLRQTADEIDSRVKLIEATVTKYLK